jgi:hypothetical protein
VVELLLLDAPEDAKYDAAVETLRGAGVLLPE